MTTKSSVKVVMTAEDALRIDLLRLKAKADARKVRVGKGK
jgi:hypothetical protein